MSGVRALLPLTLLLGVAASDDDAPEMAPGLWRTTLTIAGAQPVVTTECRGPHRLEVPTPGSGGCTDVRHILSGGAIDVERRCSGRPVTVRGRYTPSSVSLHATGVAFVPGTVTSFRIEAARVAACTPE